jgi:6-phosphogluconolactonase (cycloisomerase 2 family)
MTLKSLLLTFSTFMITVSGCNHVGNASLTMLVGTYTGGSSKGIYVYKFDVSTLEATLLSETITDNPSYLAVSHDAKHVYAVSESGGNSGVGCFAFDAATGTLSFLSREATPAGTCYVETDSAGTFLSTACYSDGAVAIFPLTPEGTFAAPANVFKFGGVGFDSLGRQSKPHLHCTVTSPDKTALFAADLGTDRIYRFDLERDNGIKVTNIDTFNLEPHSGPRHLVFNRAGSRAYLINELSGKVTVFVLDVYNKLTELQSLIADTCNAAGSADIHLSPDERFLYASTRLKGDGIVVFKVEDDGLIKKVGYHATGAHPRNFAITPDGSLMLVACRDAGMIQIFKINQTTGLLTDTGKSIPIDRAVCIKFI